MRTDKPDHNRFNVCVPMCVTDISLFLQFTSLSFNIPLSSPVMSEACTPSSFSQVYLVILMYILYLLQVLIVLHAHAALNVGKFFCFTCNDGKQLQILLTWF